MVHRLIARVRAAFEGGKSGEPQDPQTPQAPQHPPESAESQATPAPDAPARPGWRQRLHAWWEGYELGDAPAANDEPGKAAAAPKSQAAKAASSRDAPPTERPDQWSEARIKIAGLVWGDGFSFPGGTEHVLHLVKPLGLNKDKTLLDFGCGLGGASRAIAKEFGSWVRGFEESPALAQAGMEASQKAGLGKRATVEVFDPAALSLPVGKFDAALIRASFWWLPNKREFLTDVVKALRPHSMIMLTDFVVAESGQCSPALGAWIDAERRTALPCTHEEINADFTQLKIDLRISEDMTADFKRQVIDGWAHLGDVLKGQTLEPGEAVALARELDRWKLCLACMSSGELRMVRVLGIKPN